jgi:predicted porin
MKKLLAITAVAALAALGAPQPAGAIEAGEKLWIHGYGNWAYGKTDGNAYMSGTDEGSFDKLEFSLSVAAEPAQRTSVHAQIFVEKNTEGSEASVDFAFAEYAFDPALKFRIGAVKQPFGIFTETFDVGTLYPFVSLAQGIYGPAGIVSESFLGAGFTGRFEAAGGWQLQYDLYGGDMEAALTTPWAEAETEGETEGGSDIQNLIGGRLNLTSPGQAVSCGISAYTGTEDTKAVGEESESNRHTAYGAHAEYFVGPVTLRAEYAGQHTDDYKSNAAYGEAAWRISSGWQVAARYDWSKTDLDASAEVDDELLKHQDLGLAVNYFFSPNFVLKLAWHQVTGNRFTSTDDEDAQQDRKTSLVTFGTSFSF